MQYVCCSKLLNTFSDMQYLYIVKMSHNALSEKKKFQMTATDLNRAWFSLINAAKQKTFAIVQFQTPLIPEVPENFITTAVLQ